MTLAEYSAQYDVLCDEHDRLLNAILPVGYYGPNEREEDADAPSEDEPRHPATIEKWRDSEE